MSEATQIKSEVTTLIAQMGENFTFTRAGKRVASLPGVFGKIHKGNITPTGPSPTSSEQRSLIISVTTKYVPEIMDVVQDGNKTIYQVVTVNTNRFMGVDIAYTVVIT